jgi:hypothetical protein
MLEVKHHNHRKTFKILNFIHFCLTCQKTIMTLYIYIYIYIYMYMYICIYIYIYTYIHIYKLENPGNIVLSNQKKKI